MYTVRYFVQILTRINNFKIKFTYVKRSCRNKPLDKNVFIKKS